MLIGSGMKNHMGLKRRKDTVEEYFIPNIT
jgi:hypothetical protein